MSFHSGRGTVVTGRVESGVVNSGDELEIVGIKDTQKTVCTGVEMFRETFRLKVKQAITSEHYLRVLKEIRLKEVKFYQNQVQLSHIQNLKLKLTF